MAQKRPILAIIPPTPTTPTFKSHGNPSLSEKISNMKLTLAPIYPLPSGPPHAAFPKTLLHYWLLTEDEIDDMAAYYHQLSPNNPWYKEYPGCMRWDTTFLAKPDPLRMSKEEIAGLLSDEERLSVKRRMVGKFIGLRGCDTPSSEVGRRIQFLEDRFERSVRMERDNSGRKHPWYR